ncbi:MAG: DNA adenine methylase [Culturomica sp.]|jgi:DNA adenine methylase|nr:DNA adenine methylase [Culturomica sp.]
MKTPITYYGGKQTMLKYILPLIPKHNLHTEAFCGGASVLFAKNPADCEVINDLNRGLVNFYLVARKHYPMLKAEIDATLHCRDQHAHAMHITRYPEFFSPAQWAWAVWTLSKISFASKQNGTFGYDRAGKTARMAKNAADAFTEELCTRLRDVTIENDDALKIIARYDCPDAFHFVDPPYINSNCGHYEGMFNEADMQALINLLGCLKGKFMLTMFPYKSIEEAAGRHGWVIHKVERTISASKEKRRKQEEWMVCNYAITQVEG